MDLYEELKLKPVRSEPNVWIRRLVIFERLMPIPIVIRDITLTRGLNIIWAEETEEDSPAAEISGHSAGKTTFCRFLRYILGEKTFGTKANSELLRKAFPEGYVAAEMYVKGRKWAVRRPLGSGRMSYIKQGVTIEELLQDNGQSVSQDSYPQKIGLDDLLSELEAKVVVRTGEAIQWGHLLAWCSRDQEARFQHTYEWRSPRSESETPTFRFSKVGPLFVMRVALGLFLSDELKIEEKLATLQKERERLEKEIEEKEREPQFRVNLYSDELRLRLQEFLPTEQGIDTLPLHSDDLWPDLHRLTERVLSETQQEEQNRERERIQLQEQIDDVGARIRQKESNLTELETLFNIGVAVEKEIGGGPSDSQALRERMKENEDKLCPFGDVLFRDCSYVIRRRETLQITKFQDARVMKRASAKRTEERQKIERAKSALRNNVQELQQQRNQLQTKRNSLTTELQKKREGAQDLKRVRQALEIWTQQSDQGPGYKELNYLREKLEETNSEFDKLNNELVSLFRQHDKSRELLAAIFSTAVRSVLPSGSYDGEVALDNHELTFRITHGPAMTGEAVETLAVLLSDIAALVFNTVSDTAHLPGLMLHDSPREADLGVRIYRSFIRFVASLLQHHHESDNCPFQYILTTTTPPPPELQTSQYVKLQLNAAKLDQLLLRRNIAEPRDEGTNLFAC